MTRLIFASRAALALTLALAGPRLRLHRLGEPAGSDAVVAEFPEDDQTFASPVLSHDGRWVVLSISVGTESRNRLWALPVTTTVSTVTTLTKVATLDVPPWTGDPGDTAAATWYAQVTAATIHPAANRFLIRTPYRVYEYRGTPGGSFDSALAATPVALTAPSGEGQGEAVEYAGEWDLPLNRPLYQAFAFYMARR